MFLRSNFGAELRIGNGPGPTAPGENIFIPLRTFTRCGATARSGEIAYVAERQQEAIAFIREDYARFVGLCMKRFILLLGRSSAIVGEPGAGSHQELCIPGLFGAGLLGPGTCSAEAKPGSMAVFLADPLLPGYVLCRFPAPALSSSD